MKKKSWLLQAAVVLSIAFTLSSCGLGLKNLQAQGGSLVEAIDKTDLNLLNYAPEVKTIVEQHVKTAQQANSFRAFAADMIGKAKAADPAFYQSFVESLNSDDPAVREQAIKDGVSRLQVQLKAFCGGQELAMDELFNKIFSSY